MKLIYLLWGYPYDDAIIRAFETEGISVEAVKLSEEFDFENISENKNDLKEQLKKSVVSDGDIVFSVNFNSIVSDFCEEEKIPYCSWVLQLPNFDLYTSSVSNSCNYIGICDSYLVEKMWQLGIEKAFFLPDAIEIKEKTEPVEIERGLCFINKHPESALNTEGMTLYGKGYLDAFIHSQRVLMGASILENGLINRVYQEFLSCNTIPNNIISSFEKLFVADNYLAPVCTKFQQNILLKNNQNIMTIYSDSNFDMCECEKHTYIVEEQERGKIYLAKEFSLVLAPHVLHNGIPRDALEVIAAGGFPICAFQKDYAYFFEKGENLACFSNSSEFSDIVVKYGNDHDERNRVKENAYKLVEECHTYKNRIHTMLEMWSKL